MRFEKIPRDQKKEWVTFKALIRNAEVCPFSLSPMAWGQKARAPGLDWLHESTWFMSDDVVLGRVLDYRQWHLDVAERAPEVQAAADELALASLQGSPYAVGYVRALPAVVERVVCGL